MGTHLPTSVHTYLRQYTPTYASTHLPTPVTMNRFVLFACLVAVASAAQDCYTCKSGGKANWQNSGCPPSGVLSGWAAGNVRSCANPCVAMVKKWAAGNVVRGCADVFKFQLNPIPTSGCRNYKGNYVCFCEGDRCNTQNLTSIVNA